jgi:putative VirB-like lipoprotein
MKKIFYAATALILLASCGPHRMRCGPNRCENTKTKNEIHKKSPAVAGLFC